MKRIFLIRHAESHEAENSRDFDRSLNDEGHAEAPRMAKFLKVHHPQIDLFVTSTAKRALTTCRYFAEVYENKNIKKCEELYMAETQEFLEVIQNIDDQYHHIALFSHNNGLSYFANSLTDENIQNLPTCGVVSFAIDTENWSDFKNAPKKFLFLITPQDLLR